MKRIVVRQPNQHVEYHRAKSEDRKRHLEWCKARAMEYVETGDYAQAVASMVSDLSKHPGTERSVEMAAQLGGSLIMMSRQIDIRQRAIEYVEGFN